MRQFLLLALSALATGLTPHIPLEGVANLRAVSARVPRLYRSAELERATLADASFLLDEARGGPHARWKGRYRARAGMVRLWGVAARARALGPSMPRESALRAQPLSDASRHARRAAARPLILPRSTPRARAPSLRRRRQLNVRTIVDLRNDDEIRKARRGLTAGGARIYGLDGDGAAADASDRPTVLQFAPLRDVNHKTQR